MDVMLTNTTASPLTGLTWMEAFNPQQGLNLLQGTTASTSNDDAGGPARGDGELLQQPVSQRPDGDARGARLRCAGDGDVLRSLSHHPRSQRVLLADAVNDSRRRHGRSGHGPGLRPGGPGRAGKSTSLRYFVLMGDSEQQTLDLYGQINF
ncbi:MAG: hypothetical protein H6811_07235 [Phycisphaeraceae bacterium]|nr:hypothetical protein [Phycisphaeraceae bacterium]